MTKSQSVFVMVVEAGGTDAGEVILFWLVVVDDEGGDENMFFFS